MNPLAFLAKALGMDKIIVAGGLIAIIIAAFFIWLALHDRDTIKNANAKINIEAFEMERAANMEADKKAHDLAVITAQEAAQRQKDIDNAVTKYPEAARQSSGPATDAVADRLRKRENRSD